MARELADLTGESVTDAVTRAVEERLERVREQQNESLADRLLAIGKEVAPHLDEPSRTCDHGERFTTSLACRSDRGYLGTTGHPARQSTTREAPSTALPIAVYRTPPALAFSGCPRHTPEGPDAERVTELCGRWRREE